MGGTGTACDVQQEYHQHVGTLHVYVAHFEGGGSTELAQPLPLATFSLVVDCNGACSAGQGKVKFVDHNTVNDPDYFDYANSGCPGAVEAEGYLSPRNCGGLPSPCEMLSTGDESTKTFADIRFRGFL